MIEKANASRVWLPFFTLVVAVVLLSLAAATLWQGKSEKTGDAAPLVFLNGMTIGKFLPPPVIS
jgi:hypothetical protein